MSTYPAWKSAVLAKHANIGDGECVSLIVNNEAAYVEALYPGVQWTKIIGPVNGAREMANKGNSYLTWIPNDHNNPNQFPQQGDIMVFDKTPMAGYTNTFDNPYGHAGVCESASPSGYALFQQNSPAYRQAPNVTNYPWRFRPCMGWYHPTTNGDAPAAPSAPATPTGAGNTGKDLFLPPTTGPWHLYNNDGPYDPAKAKATLVPSQYGGIHYQIQADKGNGVYIVNTQMYGQGALWTKGSDVKIT